MFWGGRNVAKIPESKSILESFFTQFYWVKANSSVDFFYPASSFVPCITQFSNHPLWFSVLIVLYQCYGHLLPPSTKPCVSPLWSCGCHWRHWERRLLALPTVPLSYLHPANMEVPVGRAEWAKLLWTSRLGALTCFSRRESGWLKTKKGLG